MHFHLLAGHAIQPSSSRMHGGSEADNNWKSIGVNPAICWYLPKPNDLHCTDRKIGKKARTDLWFYYDSLSSTARTLFQLVQATSAVLVWCFLQRFFMTSVDRTDCTTSVIHYVTPKGSTLRSETQQATGHPQGSVLFGGPLGEHYCKHEAIFQANGALSGLSKLAIPAGAVRTEVKYLGNGPQTNARASSPIGGRLKRWHMLIYVVQIAIKYVKYDLQPAIPGETDSRDVDLALHCKLWGRPAGWTNGSRKFAFAGVWTNNGCRMSVNFVEWSRLAKRCIPGQSCRRAAKNSKQINK